MKERFPKTRNPFNEFFALVTENQEKTVMVDGIGIPILKDSNYDIMPIDIQEKTFIYNNQTFNIKLSSFFKLRGWDPLQQPLKSKWAKLARFLKFKKVGLAIYREGVVDPLTFAFKQGEIAYEPKQSPMMLKALTQQDLWNKAIKSILSKAKTSKKMLLIFAIIIILVIVFFVIMKGGI